MWGMISAAVVRVKRTSATIENAASHHVSVASNFLKRAPDAVRNFRHTESSKVLQPDFAIVPADLPRPSHSKLGIYVAALALALIGASLAALFGEWLFNQVETHRWSGILLAPVILIAAGFAIRALWRELTSWRRLVAIESIQSDLSDVTDTDQFRKALNRLKAALGEPHRSVLTKLIGRKSSDRPVSELRNALDRTVVHPMDSQAVGVIHRAIRDMFFLSLVSPTDITDTTAFIVRGMGMIRGNIEVALSVDNDCLAVSISDSGICSGPDPS